jgi:hypothetical protein
MRAHLLLIPACVFGVMPALADELPKRKAGLWEIKIVVGGRETPLRSIRQCADAETDALMSTNLEGLAGSKCEKLDVTDHDGTVTVDAVCKVGSATRATRAVITGDLNSAYRVAVVPGATTQGTAGSSDQPSMTIEAKWLGPCQQGQRAGDIILPGGVRLNIRSLGIERPPRH